MFFGKRYMSDTRDILSLRGIQEACEKILAFSATLAGPDELFADGKTFDAICMNLIVIGEMAGRISTGFREEHSQIDWDGIRGLRNIIAHDYFGVDAQEVWGIIEADIPRLRASAAAILRASDD
jgi:uncharacterized protein with HEPN domain